LKRAGRPFWIAALVLLSLLWTAGCSSGGSSGDEASTPVPAESDCTEADPHPIGESIASTYEVSYAQVMAWFCDGYSFENILIALETSQAVDIPAQTLLDLLLEKDWEEIWEEVGFTSQP
jgi:hypothetical protein